MCCIVALQFQWSTNECQATSLQLEFFLPCVCAFPHNRNFTTLIDNFVCIESLSRETQSIIEIAENDHRAMNIDFTACAVALFYTSLPRRKKKTTNWIEKREQKKRSANAHYTLPNVWCHCSVFPIGFECCVFELSWSPPAPFSFFLLISFLWSSNFNCY